MIKCSGEIFTEPIEIEKCLECALDMKGKQPCGYGYRLLKAMFDGQEDRSNELHVTDITGCLLKSYLDKTSAQPRFVHDMLVLWLGRAVHKAVEINDQYVTSEVNVRKDGLMGRMDAIYDDGRIEDCKTTRWMRPSNLPYGNHGDQLNIYAYLHGDGAPLQLQMIDLSGPTRCRKCKIIMQLIDGQICCPSCGITPQDAHLGAMLFEVEKTDELLISHFVDSRTNQLKEALVTGTAPEPEPSFLCNYCQHTSCIHNAA